MVFFVCDGCNETLKKNQVDKHAAKCISCWAVVCVDCNVTFPEDTYRSHTSCISEEQRYQGKLYRPPKEKKKKTPQEIWNELIETVVEEVVEAPPNLQSFLYNLGSYGNVPRNQKKFTNFAKNSLNIRSDNTVSELWSFLSTKHEEASKMNHDISATTTPDEFSTAAGISNTLKVPSIDNSKKRNRKERNENESIKTKKCKEDENSSTSTTNSSLLQEEDWIKKIKKVLKSSPNQSLDSKTLRYEVMNQLNIDTNVVSKSDMKEKFKKSISQISKVTKTGSGNNAVYSFKKK